MRKISTLMVSVLCMMMPVGAEAQVPTAFVSKGATDIQDCAVLTDTMSKPIIIPLRL